MLDSGPKDAQVRLKGVRIVLLNSSQVGANWDDRSTRACMTIL